MTTFDLIIYSAQSLFCASILIVLARGFSLPKPLQWYPWFWCVGVIAISWRYTSGQDIFYSSDQVVMANNIGVFQRDGFSTNLEVLLGRRDVVTIPAWILTNAGLHPLLAVKFLQAFAVIVTLVALLRVAPFPIRSLIDRRPWVWLVFGGPSILFNSLLALRDQFLVAGVTWFYTTTRLQTKCLVALLTFLLRPHLAVALVLSLLITEGVAQRMAQPVKRALLMFACYLLGVVLYGYGNAFTTGQTEGLPSLISQTRVLRLLATFTGLHFLVVDESTVDRSIATLFLARILFFDTWLIPIGFLLVVILRPRAGLVLQTRLLVALSIFVGISSGTDFISSRQTMPFFPMLAYATLVAIYSRQIDGRHESVAAR